MPAPRSVKAADDNFAVYAAIAIMLCVAGGFGGAWYYVKHAGKPDIKPAYVDTGPILVALNGYVVSTRLALETDKRDADWASRHKRELVDVMQNTLAATKPESILVPQGLQKLQAALTNAGNAGFGEGRIRKVLLTEFLIKENEY